MSYRESVDIRFQQLPALIIRAKNAIRKHRGNLTRAAADLGCSKRTLSRWLVAHPELAEATEEARSER